MRTVPLLGLMLLGCGIPPSAPQPEVDVPDASTPAASSDAGSTATPDAGGPPLVDAGNGQPPDAGPAALAPYVPSGALCDIPPDFVDAGGDPVNPPCRFAVDSFSTQDPKAVPARLRFATWNLEFGKNSAKVLETLQNEVALASADFLVLQEVPRDTLVSVPQRIDLARAIAQQQHLNYVYAVEWDWRNTPSRQGEWGIAVLSRYPLVAAELIRHTPLQDRWSDEQRYGGRATLAVTASVGGRLVRLHSAHFDYKGGQSGRALQGSEVRAGADAPGLPAVQLLGGDLNTWECNPLAATCNQAPAAEQVVTDFLQSWADGTPGYWGATQLGSGLFPQRLDWIFSRGVTHQGGACVTSAKGSDHLPLWTDFTLP
jgi:endonuclease/exonuclease/phosphatase family metal-dependent hydrolase